MDMLRITNLKKHFGDKEVLTGLNLSVPEHSVFGFVGENGAGKTTTMKKSCPNTNQLGQFLYF